MNENKKHRRPNGKRLDGNALAARVAQEVRGMMLAQAFVIVRGAGFQLKINKLDGVPRQVAVGVAEIVNVDVVDGFVKNSWAA